MRSDPPGLPYWEQQIPQLEEYAPGYIGCSVCHWHCTHHLSGIQLLQQWRAHLYSHLKGAQSG